MGLTVYGNVLAPQDKLIVYGQSATSLKMYGQDVWTRDGWETLPIVTREFYYSDELPISGLKITDTVDITASASFLIDNNRGDSATVQEQIERELLPTRITVGQAYIDFALADGKIVITFQNYTDSYKGSVTTTSPRALSITEVRRKL